MPLDSSQGNSFCTPRRAQKCLFGPGGNSSKDGIHRSGEKRKKGYDSAGEDSDLGPMSPLPLTDQSPSSSTSSSPRQYVSPLATPEKMSSPLSSHLSWDRLTSSSKKSSHSVYTSPFSTLKKITRSARYSPRKKTLPGSPKSLSDTTEEYSMSPHTPQQSEMTIISDEIIPETPQRNFGREIQNGIVETPRKGGSPDHRLITPLGSESKMIPLPKLHRRKSLCMLDTEESSSPERKENVLKRHAHEALAHVGSKLLKTDENYSIPKARAALFQEKTNDLKMKDFTLSTKSFYSSCEKKENFQSINDIRDNEQIKRRRSLPVQSTHIRRSLKRSKLGRINAGVSHGIKRPKPKQTAEGPKRNSLNTSQNSKSLQEASPTVTSVNETNSPVIPLKRPASPEIDPNKRFFKTNRTVKQNNATVTVNNKIKLKVTDGKILLSQKNCHPVTHPHKRQKLLEVSFDATDLTVDEPEMEASIEQSKVANILKILEDDWAVDDYDTMETLTNQPVSNTASLMESGSLMKDVTMSPTSELSNMTSTMNIEDVAAPTTFENISFTDAGNNNEKAPEQKYYPLFTKGYSAKTYAENTAQSPRTSKKNMSWQLSAKGGGGENQYQLDAGQKRFGATQCTECGIVYQLGDPEDEIAHLNYHNSRNTLKFPGWKTERIIFEDPLTKSRIILIEPDDSKQCWNKVTSILAVVDKDLGLIDAKLSEYENKKVYLYIRDKNVLGVLVAECIENAHRMIPELLELDCCTAESTPAKCGINVIWTAMSHRRQGIATKLVDALRGQFYYGYVMSVDDIAFSIPTPSGKIFAEKYTKTRNFKVYS